MNLLFTSAGRRVKLIEYFKKELGESSKVVVADCDNLVPTFYYADNYYIVPQITDPKYIEVIKKICKEEKISAILSLIDSELSLLALHTNELKKVGVSTIVSPYEVCELWLDKYKSAQFLKDFGFLCADTYNSFIDFQEAFNKGNISFPVFLKPQKGSASIKINVANNMKEVKALFESSEGMIIQEFLHGQELGVDVYVDMISKKVISIFVKEKIAMRAGETDKAKSVKSEKLFKIIEELVTKAGLVGPIDIDVFNVKGDYYISEINPRFGGGYPLAYECGVNFPNFIINNLKGNKNEPRIGKYEENIYMMKHEILIVNQITNMKEYEKQNSLQSELSL